MNTTWPATLGAGVTFILTMAALADASMHDSISTHQAAEKFQSDHPGVRFYRGSGDRVERIYGKAFATGASAIESAEKVRSGAAAIWGVRPADLVPGSTMPDGRVTTGVGWDRETQTHRFTLVSYLQTRDGVPVYGSQLRLLARNEPGHPIVLASSALRNIGGFAVDPAAAAAVDAGTLDQQAVASIGGGVIHSSRMVIFAGAGDEVRAPRLAREVVVVNGDEEWRVIVDAETAEPLHTESLLCFQSISGVVEGNATTGVGSDECEPELPRPLPYVMVTGDGESVFTDADGSFMLESPGTIRMAESILDGQWFDVFDFAGSPAMAMAAADGEETNLLFNAENTDPQVRAQVNAYLEVNTIRDFVLTHNPSYPTLDTPDFMVTVNRTGEVCANIAWYSAVEPSLNFCVASAAYANSAFASVIYHEYGHHLVAAGGSGQWSYGEGMSDALSALLLDSPLVGLGLENDCGQAFRNIETDCQFHPANCSSCGNDLYLCSLVLSGSVWDLRNNLMATDPVGFRDTVAGLAINSILLHNGATINPGITIDFLTLDDDNGDFTDGTPHYDEIAAAFGAHGMPAPALYPFTFVWSGGAPTQFAPEGSTITLDVVEHFGALDPSSAQLFHRVDGGAWISTPLTQLDADTYEVASPSGTCGQTIEFYALGTTIGTGEIVTDPSSGAEGPHEGYFGYGPLVATFSDDFETNLGWTVQNSGLADGAWQRGTPVPDCDRGAPALDADGSGQCWLTDNDPLNCNSDVDGGSTLLISPTLDASVPNAYLSYWRWYSTIEGDAPYQDTFRVHVSNNNGASWVQLEIVGPGGPEVEGGWYHRQFRIDEVIAPTNQFKVRFTALDLAPASVVEAGVDGVKILSFDCTPPTIPGDLNGDGQVDGSDLGILLGQWGGPGSADLDGNGTVDGADLGVMLGHWG